MNPGSETFLTDLMDLFQQRMAGGAEHILPDALWLLFTLAGIELAVVLMFNVNRQEDPIQLIVSKFIKISFYGWLVTNWVTGMNLTKAFFDSFQNIGVKAALNTTGNGYTDPSHICEIGIDLVSKLLQGIFAVSTSAGVMGNIGLILLKLVIILTIILCFGFMALQLFLTCVEFYMTSTLTVILVPFGVNKHTSFIAEKGMGAVLSFCMKVMVLEFILCIGVPIAEQWAQIDVVGNDLTPVIRAMLGCLTLAFLTWKGPELSQGLLSGSPSLHGGAAIGAARTAVGSVAGGVMGTAGTAMRVAGFSQAAVNSTGGRATNGGISMAGTAKNMGSMLWHQLPHRQSQMHWRQQMSQARAFNKEAAAQDAKKAQTTLDL